MAWIDFVRYRNRFWDRMFGIMTGTDSLDIIEEKEIIQNEFMMFIEFLQRNIPRVTSRKHWSNIYRCIRLCRKDDDICGLYKIIKGFVSIEKEQRYIDSCRKQKGNLVQT